jgi:hypothetical protein
MAHRSSAARRPAKTSDGPAVETAVAAKPPPTAMRVLPAPPAHAVASAPVGMLALRVVAADAATGCATLAGPDGPITATYDAALEPVVVETALARGERLVVQREGTDWVILGALRTAATPGVDRGDDYVIEARRIAIRGDHAVDLVAGATASIALRAVGRLEILAKHISSRAEGMHKLVARMIHMN